MDLEIQKNVLGFLTMKETLSADISTMVNMTAQHEMEADIEVFVMFWIDTVNEVLISLQARRLERQQTY